MTESAKAYATLTVKNFGPIGQCSLDLRPLTVFTGPSNTGKSWCATLIYALLNDRMGYRDWRFRSPRSQENFPELHASFWKRLQQEEALRLSGSEIATIRPALEPILAARGTEIERCFGLSEPEHLVSESARPGEMSITMQYPPSERKPEGWRYDLKAVQKWDCSLRLPESWTLGNQDEELFYLKSLMKDSGFGSRQDELRKSFLYDNFYNKLLLDSLYRDTPRTAWYMPADRGGIMHAHRVVVSALVRNAARAGLAPQSRIATLSGVLADFLENLVDLAGDPENRWRARYYMPSSTSRFPHADGLEEVLGGQVSISGRDVNYPSIVWQPQDWERPLDLMHASSMVTELSPVVLYLRHFVRPGDVLILEEPEAHLHPARQVEIVEQAAQWVRDGVRVILTTHSEWVLEALSNLVGTKEKGKAKKGEEEGLPASAVGLWQFKAGKGGGSEVEEIPFDEDQGGFESGYDAVAAALHNRWAAIVGGAE
ncbi:MAG: AAA family ATPase [Rhodospirillales bacterium]|nr:AAA family ATPase [Rhodospirillales bacterium]